MVQRWWWAPVLAVLFTTACSRGATGETQEIAVTLSDDGCAPRSIAARSGATTFVVTNDGSAAVTEFEVLQGDRILGEVENVIPGSEKRFSLTLKAGSLKTKCPGGAAFSDGTLEVADRGAGATTDSAAHRKAVQAYLDYTKQEADALTADVAKFVAAVKAGDVPESQRLFAASRVHYETIEPIAESFGDLDPAIDARAGDVPDAEWGGFHRIEQALWEQRSLAGMGPVADKLLADVKQLRQNLDTVDLEAAQIANGAVELLDEVSTSKITGEEDRYSHTDLSDFAANLAGSKAAFQAVRPLLNAKEAGLASDLDRRFGDVEQALAKYHGADPAGNGFALYTTLTTADTRALSSAVDALAEPLSRVAALVIS